MLDGNQQFYSQRMKRMQTELNELSTMNEDLQYRMDTSTVKELESRNRSLQIQNGLLKKIYLSPDGRAAGRNPLADRAEAAENGADQATQEDSILSTKKRRVPAGRGLAQPRVSKLQIASPYVNMPTSYASIKQINHWSRNNPATANILSK